MKKQEKNKGKKMREFQATTVLNPNSLSKQLSFAFFQDAFNSFKNGKYLDCLKTLNKVKKYDSTCEALYSLKALIYGLILGDFKVAFEELNQGLFLNPHSEKLISLKKKILELENKELYYYFYI